MTCGAVDVCCVVRRALTADVCRPGKRRRRARCGTIHVLTLPADVPAVSSKAAAWLAGVPGLVVGSPTRRLEERSSLSLCLGGQTGPCLFVCAIAAGLNGAAFCKGRHFRRTDGHHAAAPARPFRFRRRCSGSALGHPSTRILSRRSGGSEMITAVCGSVTLI